jgi:hypothetical protein
MNRQKMITVAADDIMVLKVGTLADYQHKLKMANVPKYREELRQDERRPRSLREVLGIPEGLTMRLAFAPGI